MTHNKLCDIFNEIHHADWALSDFLYLVFQHKDTDEKEIKHDHGNAVQRSLTGGCIYTPGHIINSWFHSPYGCKKDPFLMFSIMMPCTEISSVKLCLTSFVVQVVEQ